MKSRIICLETVDSTNNYLKTLTKSDQLEEGTVILAAYQTKGKGQGVNTWHSSPGLNILLSILFKPSLMVSNHFMISEFISLGIIDILKDYEIHCSIKWPNDIYYNDQKIAGILIENSISGKSISQSIAGIGLNINETEFPASIPNPVSMKLILNESQNVTIIAERLIPKLINRYKMLGTSVNSLHEEYLQLLYKKNHLTTFHTISDSFQGKIIDVLKSGELIVLKENGQIGKYLHGDIHYTPGKC